MKQPIELSFWQLAVAVSLILISAAISAALRLGLGKRLLLAAVRTSSRAGPGISCWR
jgi:ABC-type iron transport system FetAB permease component